MTIKRERKLKRIIAPGTSPQRLVLRARIVLAAGAGHGNEEVARDLGCSTRTVREWRGRFADADAEHARYLQRHPSENTAQGGWAGRKDRRAQAA